MYVFIIVIESRKMSNKNAGHPAFSDVSIFFYPIQFQPVPSERNSEI